MRLERALNKRRELLAQRDTTAWRVFNGETDGIDGLVIEKFGELLIAQLHEGRLAVDEASVRSVCLQASQMLRVRAVYRKIFARERNSALAELRGEHNNPRPWIGRRGREETRILENGLTYLIRPHDGYSAGLFLEQRDNRARLHQTAEGKRILNTFAYTCGFSLAAALGGATETVSVDVSRRYLDWGKRNFLANGLSAQDHQFIRSDVFDYLRRAERREERFDWIILDPPTFGRSKRPRRVFSLTDDLERLVTTSLQLLRPGGHVLLATNHRGTSRDRLEQMLRKGSGEREVVIVARPQLPMDFAGDSDFSKSLVARIG